MAASTITIKIEAAEIATAITKFSDAIIKIAETMQAKASVSTSQTVIRPLEREQQISPIIQEQQEPLTKIIKSENKSTIEEARKAFSELSKTKGKEVAKSILESLGVNKVTELEELGILDKAMELISEVK